MNNPLSLLKFSSKNRLPSILQTEVAECGLACLAMVTSYHGHEIDLSTLRSKFSVSLRGMNLHTLIQLADKLHFTSRALRLELDELDQLKTPAILHWDLNHFVVLKEVKNNKVHIHDPAVGVRILSMEEVSKSFTGVALELAPTHGFEEKKEVKRVRLSDFWGQIIGLKRNLLNILALSLVLQLFGLISPYYMKIVVDDVIVSNNLSLLKVLSLGFLLLSLIQMCISSIRSYVILYLSKSLSVQLSANLFRHLVRLPLSFFEKRHVGDIVSKFGSLGNIESLLTTGVVQTFVDGLMAITTLIMLFLYSPLLAVIVLLSVVLYGFIRFLWYRPFRELTEEGIVVEAKESTNFIENIRGIQSIKVFGKELDRQNQWQNLHVKVLNNGIRAGKMGIWYNVINSSLSTIQNILVVYLAAKMVLDYNNPFTVGALYAFLSYKNEFIGKATALIEKYIELKMLSLYLERLGDIALTPIEKNLDSDIETDHIIKGDIELDKISYRYSADEPMILKGISLSIKQGESVAIIGPSGCGKTTLVKIIMGLFEPEEGRVLIDGIDIAKQSVRFYRSQIAAVMQDDQLLSGPIGENISFFSTEPDQEKIERCAKLAAIHDDINAMPMRYSTLMGDMGTSLSGGQKQRVLLARALYTDPKILFLDEATSHLDVGLESVINESVKNMKITRIIVAHRPETIRSADRVLVLTPEGIIEPSLDELNLTPTKK